MPTVKVMRVLEYVGELDVIRYHLRQRYVKDVVVPSSTLTIREGYLGGALGYDVIELPEPEEETDES